MEVERNRGNKTEKQTSLRVTENYFVHKPMQFERVDRLKLILS